MAEIHLNRVRSRFFNTVDLHVDDGELFVIVGPSGAGKTSLLKAIAGLASHQGTILIDHREVQGVPSYHRAIGYVSQDLHLFPHLTVESNLFLAMDRLRLSRSRKRAKAKELMELLRITQLSPRKPSTLSGGEKQRAALARVLASSPRVLLLDEPFSKLDFRTGRYLRSEFKSLQRRLGLTTILVTHNMEEAGELADTLAVMRSGSLVRIGSPSQLLHMSESQEDSFLEMPNVLECRDIRVLGNGLIEVRWAGTPLFVPDEGRDFSHITISCRDIEIDVKPPPGPTVNRFNGYIRKVEDGDDSVRITLNVNGATLRVETPPEKWEKLTLNPGDRVHGLLRLRALELC